MPQTIFVPRVDAILTAASESIGFFLLLSFTVIFYFYLLLLSFTVIVFGSNFRWWGLGRMEPWSSRIFLKQKNIIKDNHDLTIIYIICMINGKYPYERQV